MKHYGRCVSVEATMQKNGDGELRERAILAFVVWSNAQPCVCVSVRCFLLVLPDESGFIQCYHVSSFPVSLQNLKSCFKVDFQLAGVFWLETLFLFLLLLICLHISQCNGKKCIIFTRY